MDPRRNLVVRAWESLTEGWRELLARSSGALTRFDAKDTRKAATSQEHPRWSLLAAETWETAQSIVIRMEVSGIDKEKLAIDVAGNQVRISGEKHQGTERPSRRYHLMERAYGRFERTFTVPHGVETDGAEVSYRDGVVVVILPKTEPVPPRQLAVD